MASCSTDASPERLIPKSMPHWNAPERTGNVLFVGSGTKPKQQETEEGTVGKGGRGGCRDGAAAAAAAAATEMPSAKAGAWR